MINGHNIKIFSASLIEMSDRKRNKILEKYKSEYSQFYSNIKCSDTPFDILFNDKAILLLMQLNKIKVYNRIISSGKEIKARSLSICEIINKEFEHDDIEYLQNIILLNKYLRMDIIEEFISNYLCKIKRPNLFEILKKMHKVTEDIMSIANYENPSNEEIENFIKEILIKQERDPNKYIDNNAKWKQNSFRNLSNNNKNDNNLVTTNTCNYELNDKVDYISNPAVTNLISKIINKFKSFN